MSDETDPLAAAPMWSDALRRLRELGAQMTAAAQAVAVAGARVTPPALASPLARYADQLLAVSAAVTTPLRRLLDEQERLVEMMAAWAEQHRLLSEQIADWAEQQRRMSEQMVELARPFLDQSAMVESLQAEWTSRSPDGCAGREDGGEAGACVEDVREEGSGEEGVDSPALIGQVSHRNRLHAFGRLHVRPRLASMTIHRPPNIASSPLHACALADGGRRGAGGAGHSIVGLLPRLVPDRCLWLLGQARPREIGVDFAGARHERPPSRPCHDCPGFQDGACDAATFPQAFSAERSCRRP